MEQMCQVPLVELVLGRFERVDVGGRWDVDVGT